MFIIGESLQNRPNIVNAAVINWQSVWMSASLPWVFILFAENGSSSLEKIRMFELRRNDTEEAYFGSQLRQSVVQCLTRAARRAESAGHYS